MLSWPHQPDRRRQFTLPIVQQNNVARRQIRLPTQYPLPPDRLLYPAVCSAGGCGQGGGPCLYLAHTRPHNEDAPGRRMYAFRGRFFVCRGVRTLGETWMAGMPVRYPCCSSERGSAWRNGKTALRRRFRPDPDRRLLRCCRLGYDGLFPLRSWFWGSGGERPDGGLLVAWWSSVARQSAACSWMWPVEGPIFALRQQMSILRHIPSGWEFVEM